MIDQALMDNFFATHSYDKTPGDWRSMPSTDPDNIDEDSVEKVALTSLLELSKAAFARKDLEELVDRLFAALERHGYVAKGDVPGHEFYGNQWTGGLGEKPKTANLTQGKKNAVFELLATGHPFTYAELQALTGAKDATLKTALADLKNPKYASSKGVLDIVKEGDHYVVKAITKPGEQPKPDTPAKEDPTVAGAVAPQGAGKMDAKQAEEAYQKDLDAALNKLAASKGFKKDLQEFKQAKLTAMAQWKANTTGTPQVPNKPDGKNFPEDDKLYSSLASGLSPKEAYATWKADTAIAKQAAYSKAVESKKEVVEPPAATSGTAKQGIPSDVVPKSFAQIGQKDFEEAKFSAGVFKAGNVLGKDSLDSVENKKVVEAMLNKELASSSHYQWLAAHATPGSMTTAGRLVSSWASSSGDSHPLSVALQLAVRDVFKMKDQDLAYNALDALKAHGESGVMLKAATELLGKSPSSKEVSGVQSALHEFVAAQYRATQSFFAERGVKELYLARGMKVASVATAEHVTLRLQPASSFSTSMRIARNFAGSGGSVFLTKVPVSQVLGSYRTGFGCTNEKEVVVLAHGKTEAVKIKAGALGPTGASVTANSAQAAALLAYKK